MPQQKTYRVGIIGATGRGDYGHGLDTAFVGVERAEIVAVADANEAGRNRVGSTLKVQARYADYHEMLARESLDIVCIGPRWVTDRVEMLTAVTKAGCHIYCEKPFLADLESLDVIKPLFDGTPIKLAMAHQWRAMPPVQLALQQLRAGRFGPVRRLRARPKDDARGGGEELLVHGTHWFDLMLAIAGAPEWVSGHITTQSRDITKADRRDGSEPAGPLAGDNIVAVFGFANGVRGFFDSSSHTAPSSRKDKQELPLGPNWDSVYGLTVECERATLQWRQPGDVYVYPAAGVLPDIDALQWEKLWVEDWHFTPEHMPRPIAREWLAEGNRRLAQDLMRAIDMNREPLSPWRHAKWITEMVQGVYASHFADGRRLKLPLIDRLHPLR